MKKTTSAIPRSSIPRPWIMPLYNIAGVRPLYNGKNSGSRYRLPDLWVVKFPERQLLGDWTWKLTKSGGKAKSLRLTTLTSPGPDFLGCYCRYSFTSHWFSHFIIFLCVIRSVPDIHTNSYTTLRGPALWLGPELLLRFDHRGKEPTRDKVLQLIAVKYQVPVLGIRKVVSGCNVVFELKQTQTKYWNQLPQMIPKAQSFC